MIILSDANHIPLKDKSVDLIITSPPYANMRKKLYGGIAPDKYAMWFKPIADEIMRVLKTDGSFILNIKENASNEERHTYVYELVLSMRQWGWLWIEEYIWYKRSGYPGRFSNRFRDAFERVYHFALSKDMRFYRDVVKIDCLPIKNIATYSSKNGNNYIIKNIDAFKKKTKYPTNVLDIPVGDTTYAKHHPATFPIKLPKFFINLLTIEGDIVLDPFAGAGTAVSAARMMNRQGIGLEIMPKYVSAGNKLLPLPLLI